MNYTEQFKEHIEYRFASFCKIVLRYEAINAWRDMSRIIEWEISLDYLVSERYYAPHTIDKYFVEPTPFSVNDETVYIEDKLLTQAIMSLSEHKREIVLLYFFFGYTDRKAGQKYGVYRSTVNYQKTAALKQLRAELERLGYGE
ncbi:MAG: sigma factor-like helix-turn-helix DNA-binding protein [Candidatus Metalachnospira sp.]|nr:sigma factor-like helix-turn-helix DNA-binding protein [Candidatus Metalachnospira sp.]